MTQYLILPLMLIMFLASKIMAILPVYPLPALFLVSRKNLRFIGGWLSISIIVLGLFYLTGLYWNLKHSAAFIFGPILFKLLNENFREEKFLEKNFFSSLTILSFTSLFFLIYQIKGFQTEYNLLHHEASRAVKSSLLIFTFYSLLILNQRYKSYNKYLNAISLLTFFLAESKLLFISSLFLMFFSQYRIPHSIKKFTITPFVIFALIPFLIFEGSPIFTNFKNLLNGRDHLYPLFYKNLGFLPKGIGFSSNQVTSFLKTFYPPHEMTSYIHNVHMELINDLGLFIYLILLAVFSWITIKKKFYFTAFIVLFTLSFGYTIYSPLTVIMLALSVSFDQRQNYSEVPSPIKEK